MKTKTKQSMSAAQLHELVLQAAADFRNDRRSEPRYPFFHSASILIDGHCYSAFTREISTSAIGLLHNVELPLQEVEIIVGEKPHALRTRIERCQACGDGWYISAGTFVGADA
jgi:hypothetical protein